MRTHPVRNLLLVPAGVLAAIGLAACGSSTPTAGGSSSATGTSAAPVSTPGPATVVAQATASEPAAATTLAAPVTGATRAKAPTGKMKYGESMGYALPETKDWNTALEVRVTDLAATKSLPAGWFELIVANRTGSQFDLGQMQIRAVDSSGKTVAELGRDGANASTYKPLPSPAVMSAPFHLDVDAKNVQIWVQPSPTSTDITSWSTDGS